ncbi:MAG: bacteriocin [Lachnospiraceae bacterium]|nr:bacteriocin [Lachnospiraceae bacterium]
MNEIDSKKLNEEELKNVTGGTKTIEIGKSGNAAVDFSAWDWIKSGDSIDLDLNSLITRKSHRS